MKNDCIAGRLCKISQRWLLESPERKKIKQQRARATDMAEFEQPPPAPITPAARSVPRAPIAPGALPLGGGATRAEEKGAPSPTPEQKQQAEEKQEAEEEKLPPYDPRFVNLYGFWSTSPNRARDDYDDLNWPGGRNPLPFPIANLEPWTVQIPPERQAGPTAPARNITERQFLEQLAKLEKYFEAPLNNAAVVAAEARVRELAERWNDVRSRLRAARAAAAVARTQPQPRTPPQAQVQAQAPASAQAAQVEFNVAQSRSVQSAMQEQGVFAAAPLVRTPSISASSSVSPRVGGGNVSPSGLGQAVLAVATVGGSGAPPSPRFGATASAVNTQSVGSAAALEVPVLEDQRKRVFNELKAAEDTLNEELKHPWVHGFTGLYGERGQLKSRFSPREVGREWGGGEPPVVYVDLQNRIEGKNVAWMESLGKYYVACYHVQPPLEFVQYVMDYALPAALANQTLASDPRYCNRPVAPASISRESRKALNFRDYTQLRTFFPYTAAHIARDRQRAIQGTITDMYLEGEGIQDQLLSAYERLQQGEGKVAWERQLGSFGNYVRNLTETLELSPAELYQHLQNIVEGSPNYEALEEEVEQERQNVAAAELAWKETQCRNAVNLDPLLAEIETKQDELKEAKREAKELNRGARASATARVEALNQQIADLQARALPLEQENEQAEEKYDDAQRELTLSKMKLDELLPHEQQVVSDRYQDVSQTAASAEGKEEANQFLDIEVEDKKEDEVEDEEPEHPTYARIKDEAEAVAANIQREEKVLELSREMLELKVQRDEQLAELAALNNRLALLTTQQQQRGEPQAATSEQQLAEQAQEIKQIRERISTLEAQQVRLNAQIEQATAAFNAANQRANTRMEAAWQAIINRPDTLPVRVDELRARLNWPPQRNESAGYLQRRLEEFIAPRVAALPTKTAAQRTNARTQEEALRLLRETLSDLAWVGDPGTTASAEYRFYAPRAVAEVKEELAEESETKTPTTPPSSSSEEEEEEEEQQVAQASQPAAPAQPAQPPAPGLGETVGGRARRSPEEIRERLNRLAGRQERFEQESNTMFGFI